MVAVSPDLPDNSLSMVEKHNLKYEVLSDFNHGLARKFGIVYTVEGELAKLYDQYGIDLKKSHGSDAKELPLAATYLIDKDGIIRYAYLDVDYTKRAEPDDILKALSRL